jgi:hypothetical protein
MPAVEAGKIAVDGDLLGFSPVACHFFQNSVCRLNSAPPFSG